MHNYKQVDFGFIILCPEKNIGGLRGTLRSATNHYPKSPCIAILGEDATKEDIKEFSQFCPSFRAGKTITSLINQGFKESQKDWNFLVFAGSTIKQRFYHKYAYFLEDEKDILFPIVEGHCHFIEGSLNGVFMHKQAIRDVGEFNDLEIDLAKFYWTYDAMLKGYRFKALMGAKIL